MKFYTWVVSSILSVFLILLLIFLQRTKSITDLHNSWIIQPEDQIIEKRSWRNVKFIEAGISDDFITSDNLIFGPDGYLYAEDLDRLIVNKYDMDGSVIQQVGKGEGEGPGEFRSITDIEIDSDGNIWALDPLLTRATVFKPGYKDLWMILEFPAIPHKVIPLNSDEYLKEERFGGYIERYTYSGELTGKLPVLVDDPPLWSNVLTSIYSKSIDGSIVAVQIFTNYLVRYSKEGKIKYYRKSVSSPDIPKIDPYYANDAGRVNSVDYRSWKQTSRDVHIVDNAIHVFIIKDYKWIPEENRFESERESVDVYDLETGNYLYSYKIPLELQTMAVSETHLAGIPEELGKLVIWEVQGGWPEIKKRRQP